ncbi:MAG: sugar phosphate isomerase/epimerase [bacterium]|nr:sugar phosphate isomerase/epimerase [bacterium]
MMKLAYSTYALQTIDPFEAVSRVRQIGFEGLELNVGDDWPTAPGRLDGDTRQRLREAYAEAKFPAPVLMNLIGLCGMDEDTKAKERALAETCQLAADLNFDGGLRVVTSTLGANGGDWDACRDRVAAAMLPYARIAEDHGVTLAIEAHVGQELDSPEKAVWLVEAVGRPSVRLNFDHSHFHVLNMDLRHCAQLCAPYSVHTHIKDGCLVGGQVQFQLPGDGSLDLTEYFRVVRDVGINLPITAEVSAQIWKKPDYDPWATARRCFDLLRSARDAAV